jgi:hypothetical protein
VVFGLGVQPGEGLFIAVFDVIDERKRMEDARPAKSGCGWPLKAPARHVRLRPTHGKIDLVRRLKAYFGLPSTRRSTMRPSKKSSRRPAAANERGHATGELRQYATEYRKTD